MSDLFHKDVPLEFIRRRFELMQQAHWRHFQVPTKRAERLAVVSRELEWQDNNLNLAGIDWVIVGGESGPGARSMREQWVLDIQATCAEASVSDLPHSPPAPQ